MAKDMTLHQNDNAQLQVVNIAIRKEAFDKIAKEAKENRKKAISTCSYSGLSVGGKTRIIQLKVSQQLTHLLIQLHLERASRVRVRPIRGIVQLVRVKLDSLILSIFLAKRDIRKMPFAKALEQTHRKQKQLKVGLGRRPLQRFTVFQDQKVTTIISQKSFLHQLPR